MYQKGRNRKVYIKYILAMLILLTVAVFGPQLLFAVQDKHNQESTWLGTRDRMDVTALNAGYTKSLRDRLTNFAKGLSEEKQYYANATDYEYDEEGYEILENVLSSNWFSFLGVYLSDIVYVKGYDVEAWKRYTIYDEEFENGVAFMAWYFEIIAGNGQRIKLLVDTEDYTLYYAEMECAEQIYDYYVWDDKVRKGSSEFLEYFWYYYEAEIKETVISTDGHYETYGTPYEAYMVYMREGLYNIMLPYGTAWLHWELEVTEETEQEPAKISIGIREIGEILPEFKAG